MKRMTKYRYIILFFLFFLLALLFYSFMFSLKTLHDSDVFTITDLKYAILIATPNAILQSIALMLIFWHNQRQQNKILQANEDKLTEKKENNSNISA